MQQAISGAAVRPFRAPSARQRRITLEAALERLLGVVEHILNDLDAIDGDPDFEPSLGFPERRISYPDERGRFALGAAGAQDDREEVCEDEGAETGDDEPSPGWSEAESVAARPGFHPFSLPSDEDEPSLGSGPDVSQLFWGRPSEGWQHDAEWQCEGEGDYDEREPEEA